MIILADKGQKAGKHEGKHCVMKQYGHEVIMAPLPVGDYILGTDRVLDVMNRRKEKLKKMDFMGSFSISVDTKASVTELYGNLIQDHKRFHDECVLAQNCGIKLYVLIENEYGFLLPKDIMRWKNPQVFKWYKNCRQVVGMQSKSYAFKDVLNYARDNKIKLPREPCTNEHLITVMSSMAKDYGVEFLFCSKKDAGKRVIELLKGGV